MNGKKLLLWLAVSAALFLFFLGSDRIPIMSGDEGRYAEIAREMWETKDFVTPQFNYTHLLEKPILAHFLTALSFAVFGVSAGAARLPSIFSGILLIGLTYGFTRRFFEWKAATFAAFVMITSAGYVLMGRMAMIDMLLTLFMSTALFSFFWTSVTGDRRFYFLAYTSMGLALITKGLIGAALPLAVYVIYLAVTKKWSELKHLYLVRGLLIMAVIFVPWGIAISIREPEFSYVFFTQHQIQRFATGSFGRVKPFWFFVPIFAVMYFPWSLIFPVAVKKLLKSEDKAERNKIVYLFIWAMTILIFFSIPRSKLVHYILPMSAPVSILVGLYLNKIMVGSSKARLRAVVVGMYLFIVCLIGAMYYLSPNLSTAEFAKYLKPKLKKEDVVAIYASPDHFSDLPFYLSQRVVVVGSDRGTLDAESREDEAEFEADGRHAAKKWFLESGPFIELFSRRESIVYCLLDTKRLDELTHIGLKDYFSEMEGHGKILISNRTA